MKIFRTLLAALLLASSFCLPLRAAQISLDEVSGFLNDLTTARGSFTQINPDGTISTGAIFIQRPGRIRFEYDPPDPALVLAGGGTVAIFDGKSNEPPQQFPLNKTPLSVILRADVDLAASGMIAAIRSDDVSTTVTAQDPKRPETGFIDLVFTDNPVELRQWVITDESGAATTVILGDLEKGMRINATLFSVQAELDKRRPKGR